MMSNAKARVKHRKAMKGKIKSPKAVVTVDESCTLEYDKIKEHLKINPPEIKPYNRPVIGKLPHQNNQEPKYWSWGNI